MFEIQIKGLVAMRFWHSIVGKIWGTIILLLTGVLVATGFFIGIVYEDKNTEQITNKIKTTTENIGHLIEGGAGFDTISSAINLLDQPMGVIVEKNGKSVASKQTSMHVSEEAREHLFNDEKMNDHLAKGKYISETYNFYGTNNEKYIWVHSVFRQWMAILVRYMFTDPMKIY
ncbi:putative two-component sensor histidine kinase ResE [Listeria rocourtiae FSL F6-920]|nr:putative two-component sensor histidine kinase ResE [Listeria rocourtiae FSL F6-920]